MKTITTDQRELIDALLAEQDVGGISAAILEKDIHVTDALRALSAIAHEHVRLVFCGGTSLSKAHSIIAIGEYADKLIPLIYGRHKPPFNEAFGVFKDVANKLLGTL